jgi:hypothetical protein
MALSTVTTFAYSRGTSVGAAAMCGPWLEQDLERELRRAAATQHVASLPEIGVGGGELCRFGLVEAQVAKLLSAPPEDLVFGIEKRESRL